MTRERFPCVHIMANSYRTVYTGVTSDLYPRVWQHKHHALDGFTKDYGCTKLMYIAEFSRMDDAIVWE